MKHLLAGLALVAANASGETHSPTWTQLRPLPDKEGFAGSYAGVTGGALVVAGGANFPDKRPWEGGVKVWYDKVFALEKPNGDWRLAGKLPRPAGYGVSVTTGDGVLLIGGGDAAENFRDVLLLKVTGAGVSIEPLAPLPLPLAMCAGAVVGDAVHVAGGLSRPDATSAENVFLRLDLRKRAAAWERLPSWPGKERFLAVAGSARGTFFLIGGARLIAGPDGKPQREWLRDAYCYTADKGWATIADLPRPVVAAPSPAIAPDDAHLIVLGGDDGSLLQHSPTDHPGFPRRSLAYDLVRNVWTEAGEIPFSLVTTSLAEWNGRWIVPGGEARPGVRSPAVWQGSLNQSSIP